LAAKNLGQEDKDFSLFSSRKEKETDWREIGERKWNIYPLDGKARAKGVPEGPWGEG